MQAGAADDEREALPGVVTAMRIVVMPGDGIGPEITQATMQVLEAASDRFAPGLRFERHEVGFASLEANGATITPDVLARCREADGMVLGPISHADYPPRAEGGINVSSELRVKLDLYANIRPSRSRDGLPHWGRTPMDLVIVRENTEGFYADRNMFLGIGEFSCGRARRRCGPRRSRASHRGPRRQARHGRIRRSRVRGIGLALGPFDAPSRDFPRDLPHHAPQLHRRAHLEAERKAHQLARAPLEIVRRAAQEDALRTRLREA